MHDRLVSRRIDQCFLVYLPVCIYFLPECKDYAGLISGNILDIMMSVSSSFDDLQTGPGRARVNQSESEFFFLFYQ